MTKYLPGRGEQPNSANIARLFGDRAAVLLLGVTIGAIVGLSFHRSSAAMSVAAPAVTPVHFAGKPQSDMMAAQICPDIWANVRAATAAGRPIRVGVFGDSYGEGLFAALERQLPHADGFEVTKYSRLSTGFTRFRVFDVEKDAAGRLGKAPLEIAVISFGANDSQAVFTAKHKYAALMSPEWQAEIGPRVDRFVALLRAHHALVFWVGLPHMRDPDLDRTMMAVNDFYAGRMAALGVPFMESRPLVAGPDGGFSAYLTDPKSGENVKMRLDDGIHMTFQGYSAISQAVAARVRAYVDGARAANAAEARP